MNNAFKISLIISILFFSILSEAVEHTYCISKIPDQDTIRKLALLEFNKKIKKKPKNFSIAQKKDNADEWVYLIESEDRGDQPGSHWLILINKCTLKMQIFNGY